MNIIFVDSCIIIDYINGKLIIDDHRFIENLNLVDEQKNIIGLLLFIFHANNKYPAEFIYQNMIMEANVTHKVQSVGVLEATNEPIMEQKLKDKMSVQYDT